MRVIHIITRMIVGGAQENTLFNCVDLRELYGDDVLLVTGPSIGPEGDLMAQGRAGAIATCLVPSLRRAIHPLHDRSALRSLRKVIREFEPDIVHTHSAKGGLLGRLAAYQERVPVIVHTVHGAPFHPYQSMVARNAFRLCETLASKWCDRMISVADAMTDLMVNAKVADREKFRTIYSGMDVEPFLHAKSYRESVRRSHGIEPDEIVIGKIARLFHLKGHDDLLAAASAVTQACPRIRFLLVGDGILREKLEKRIAELKLGRHFIFTGLVPPSEVPKMIGAMDALVHTSYREGLARALPQALISGIPVISYDVDGAREVVVNDETGFLVPAGDTPQLAARIIQLATNPDARLTMGETGRERFTDQFRHQSMTRDIRALYAQLLANPVRKR